MSLRILLADESSMIKKAFEIGLNSYGAEIKNVQHGIDVLEVAESFKPDIIFADVLISKMNGYDVCSQIKQNPRLNTIPVVLMWSGFMDIDEDKYFTCQADGKIEKPFSAEQVLNLIQSLVQKPLGSQDQASYNDSPPALSQQKSVSASPAPKKQMNPAEDLLFKEDIKSSSEDLFEDLNSSTESDEEDNFGFDNFQAVDLHSDEEKLSDENEEYREITKIPTFEEEQNLFNKLKEDTAIRHGSGFLDMDELESDLGSDFLNVSSNEDDSAFEDIFSTASSVNPTSDPNTIHRDVEDFHNSDAGVAVNSEDLFEIKTSSPFQNQAQKQSQDQFQENAPLSKNIDTLVHQLSKEEITQIIKDQAKELIQSIVWEMVPELSKQMIEKEIKRLLTDTENSKPNSF